MKIIIVRHAETDKNINGNLAQRESDILLNENGKYQAQKLGEFLKTEKISHVYTSPLQRAVDTSKYISQHHPQAMFAVAPELIEQDKKAESYPQLQQRAKAFFSNLVEKHGDDDTVLVVSHGGTLGVLMVDILGKELTEENYRAHQPKNAEFTVIEVSRPTDLQIHKLNSREHLEA